MHGVILWSIKARISVSLRSNIIIWIKYEEEVEESADRWSKPHVAVQPLMSVFEVRSCLAKAVMLLDLEVTSLELVAVPKSSSTLKSGEMKDGAKAFCYLPSSDFRFMVTDILATPALQVIEGVTDCSLSIVALGCMYPFPSKRDLPTVQLNIPYNTAFIDAINEVVQRMVKKKMLDPSLREQTRDLLLLHHSTLYTRQKRRVKTGQQLHIIRSLAEIGKRHSAKDVNKLSHVPSHSIVKSATNLGVDRMDPQIAATSANDPHTPDNIESTQVPITLLETTEIHISCVIQIKRKINQRYEFVRFLPSPPLPTYGSTFH
ncbi:hypothetical protein ACTXT7_009528 [Hymenolepis weldensis]